MSWKIELKGGKVKMSWSPPGRGGRSIEDIAKEKESLNITKKYLLAEIPFFSDLSLDSDLLLFKSALLSKLGGDLSNLSKKNCKIKETSKFILKYNEIVREYVYSPSSWMYTIDSF